MPKAHEAGVSAGGLCRKQGTGEAIFYNGRRKYGGMKIADAKRLKTLQPEFGVP